MTDDVLSQIKARQKKKGDKEDTATQLYQSISTMKDFRLDPASWSSLSRLDKKVLHYYRIMEYHYMDQINEKHDRERKLAQQKQDFMNKLPQQARGGR